MPQITAQLLKEFPYAKVAAPATIKRGRDYFETGRVTEWELVDNKSALCLVHGDSDDYEVGIFADKSPYGLAFECNCPYADEGNFCKHMVAAALDLADYLEDEEQAEEILPAPAPRAPAAPRSNRKWRDQLGQALSAGPQRSYRPTAAGSVGLVILGHSNYYNYGYSLGSAGVADSDCTLTPIVIQA